MFVNLIVIEILATVIKEVSNTIKHNYTRRIYRKSWLGTGRSFLKYTLISKQVSDRLHIESYF